MNSKTEKRRFARVSFNTDAEIYPVFPSYADDFPDLPLTGQARDISGGGIAFKAEQSLKVGSFLKLRFEMEKNQMVEAFGKVVWAEKAFCGISFDSMNGFPGQ